MTENTIKISRESARFIFGFLDSSFFDILAGNEFEDNETETWYDIKDEIGKQLSGQAV